MKPAVAITMGDAAGIGPEILAKAYASSKLSGLCRPFLIGSADVLEEAVKSLRLPLLVNAIENLRDGEGKAGIIDVVDLKNIRLSALKKGRASVMCGRASIDYVRKAAGLALSGEVDAVVTCPINKEAVLRAGFCGGHTELLSKLTHTSKFAMMLTAGRIRVVLLTRHVPIKSVGRLVTKKRILETVKLIESSAADFGLVRSAIAVLGLNPHCGDGGLSGREEREEIIPAIRRARESGIMAEGPFSADGFFGSGTWKNYDFILAMYHDQGLIPFKMQTFGLGVNITLGLPIVRTSVDHGTGYDIVGKGKASEKSLIEAVRMASEVVRRRAVKSV